MSLLKRYEKISLLFLVISYFSGLAFFPAIIYLHRSFRNVSYLVDKVLISSTTTSDVENFLNKWKI